MVVGTVLVVLTTNESDSAAIAAWLEPQLSVGEVVKATGYYAAMSALEQQPRAVVVDAGIPKGPDDWRLAELRARHGDAAFVVVADATLLPMLAGAIHADLAVTSVDDLPPLRELLLTDEPVITDQTSWRRTRR
jgi:hypothetical protein